MTDVTMTWDGDGDDGETTDPTLADLERRIRDLDGSQRTIVTLQNEAGYFAVGGSADTGLVVYADLGDGEFWTAPSPDTSATDMITVVAGGQPGDYEARLVTTLDVALSAARGFLESGRLLPEIDWQRN